MNILQYADVLNLRLVINYHPNQNTRFSAQFDDTELKRDSILIGAYGNGKTPEAAVLDYLNQIRGKRLVVNAYRNDRAEYVVPHALGGLP